MIKDEEIVKDVVAVGLQILMSGEKNPLSDYNTAFKRLQMRRKMKPVTLTLLQGHSESANPQTPPVLDVPPQTPLETPLIPTTEADEEAEVVDPEQVSEVEKILQDLADGVVKRYGRKKLRTRCYIFQIRPRRPHPPFPHLLN